MKDRRRLLGNLMGLLGLLLLLIAGITVLRSQIEGERLRAQLRQLPPADARDDSGRVPQAEAAYSLVPTPTPEPAAPPPAVSPSPVAVPSMPPPSPTAAPSVTPTVTPIPTPTAIPSSPPVRIVIPDLNLDVPVEEMPWQVVNTDGSEHTEWLIPHNAAGYALNSAPLGVPGNVVISGHNNIYGRVFESISYAWDVATQEQIDDTTFRSHLLDGRRIEVYAADGRRFDYVITEFYRVKDQGLPLEQRIANARFIQPTEDARLTVTTCWPPTSNTDRLIVIALPAE